MKLLFPFTLQPSQFILCIKSLLGDFSGGGTPGPIPNPVVKPASTDDTACVGVWERRSSPANPSGLFDSSAKAASHEPRAASKQPTAKS